jgi:cytochrome c oxidase subunit 3
VAFSLFGILFNLVCYLHELAFSSIFLFIYSFLFLFSACNWFYDIVIEATYQCHHTLAVQQGLRYGMVLFIVSEVMFFFAFFWAFFYSSISPTIAVGCVWPPLGIEPLNA